MLKLNRLSISSNERGEVSRIELNGVALRHVKAMDIRLEAGEGHTCTIELDLDYVAFLLNGIGVVVPTLERVPPSLQETVDTLCALRAAEAKE